MAAPRRDTAAESTLTGIKEYLVSNGLRPGDPMPTEAELADLLGVSRSSLREAVRTLVALDIVEVRHGVGMFVGGLSLRPLVEGLAFRGVLTAGDDLRALREVVDVRESLDLALADQVTQALAGRHLPDLHEVVDQMVALSEQGHTFLAQDRAFHTQLLHALGNQLLEQLVGAFWDVHTIVLPRLHISHPADITDTARAHGAMLRAAEAGDPDAYAAAVRDHYAPLRRVLTEHEALLPMVTTARAS